MSFCIVFLRNVIVFRVTGLVIKKWIQNVCDIFCEFIYPCFIGKTGECGVWFFIMHHTEVPVWKIRSCSTISSLGSCITNVMFGCKCSSLVAVCADHTDTLIWYTSQTIDFPGVTSSVSAVLSTFCSAHLHVVFLYRIELTA